MSRKDFCHCTPFEFSLIYERWMDGYRDRWEQTRFIAICILQPHSSNSLKPWDVLPLPWDDKPEDHKPKELSREEEKARYEAALKRYGITT